MSQRLVILGSIAVGALLVALLAWNPSRDRTRHAQGPPLLVYCAAGLQPAIEPAVRAFEAETGARVQIQYGGSGTLLANLRVSRVGDLFVAADHFFIEIARSNALLAEVIPLARLTPTIAVARGNPKAIRSLDDLLREDVHLVLANPDAAAIGRVVRDTLLARGTWDRFETRARAFKPTVNDLANDLKLGTADAAIVWDATVRQYPELDAVPDATFADAASEVAVGVLEACTQPAAALALARFLAAPERGGRHMAEHGFAPVAGDPWVRSPELILFSGGVNRVAIEETLRAFEAREGVGIQRVYNGCGILTAQIRAGQKPDGYFACDVSFMRTVGDEFHAAVELAETRMVIATPPGNPRGLQSLQDLARPGLKVGLANEEQSALGALSARLLRKHGWLEAVMANVVVQTPTADLLVNQLRAGGLDAVVVYEANTRAAGEAIAVIPISLDGATAIQPLAVGRQTRYPQLMRRLMDTLCSEESRRRFETTGFRWRVPSP
ncbi:MAG: extracellular solute-binding protein [Verrucomicrobiae bacterium]|nr:extracellular solute-binding protein [Verrucomicrobiae bacterium]